MDSTKPPSLTNWWEETRQRAIARDHMRDSQLIHIYAVNRDNFYENPVNDDSGKTGTRTRFLKPVDYWFDANAWPTAYNPDFKIHHGFVAVTSAPIADVTPMNSHHSNEWGAAALGWAGGTLVLALFLLLVRTVEKCFDKKCFKSTRDQPGQSQTADVFSIRPPRPDDAEHGTAGQDDDLSEPISDVDLPPPYRDCATEVNIISEDTKPPACREEDLPSYSDCYVPVNHKGALAPVYIYCTREPRNKRSLIINVVPVNGTASDVETPSEQSKEVPDSVVQSAEADISKKKKKKMRKLKRQTEMIPFDRNGLTSEN